MSDTLSPEARSRAMRAVRSRDTTPERRLRHLLWSAGHRYRLHADLPGRPDLVFRGARLAVFVHGCFWHGHPCPRGARAPKTNAAYWRAKIARNIARDEAALQALAALGWRAEVVWECELKAPAAALARLEAALALPRRGAPRRF